MGYQGRCLGVCGAIAVLGCGSPAADPSEAPSYESSNDFRGTDSGAIGEPGLGNGEDYPSNNPSYAASPSRYAALAGRTLVVMPGADYSVPLPYRPSRGVVVYSFEEVDAPQLVTELPFVGSSMQLLPGTEHVTIVARAPRDLALSEIPTTPMFGDTTVLMRLDLSDPSAPQLVARTELAGEFWQAIEQDGYLFVLSQIRRPTGQDCESYETSSAATTETMRVTSYQFDGERYELVDEQDLPGDGYAAFRTSSAFVSVLGNYEESPTLSIASLSNAGEITISAPVAVAGPVTAVDLSGTSLAVATLPRDEAKLSLFDASELSALAEQWSQPLPQAAYRLSQTELLAEPVILGDGWLSRKDGATPPELVSPAAYRLIAIEADALLAAERAPDGKVLLSSWTASAPLTLTRTSELATEWPALADDGSGSSGPFAWEATTRTLYYSFSVLSPQSASGAISAVGLVGLSSGVLQSVGDVMVSENFGTPFVDEQGAYLVGGSGLQSVTAGPQPSASAFEPFFDADAERTVARRITDVGEFVLVQRGDAVVLRYPPSESGERREEPLPHFASELVVEGGAIAAVGVYWNQDCGRELGIPESELGCPVPRQRGITFVALSEPPGAPRTLSIDDSLDAPSLPDDTEQTATWFGYVRRDGRLLLPVTRLIRCNTAEACDELGFPWYTSFGSPGCNPGVEDCAEKPAIEQFVQGYGRESLLYVLDPATAEAFDEPVRFGDGVDFQQTMMTPEHELGAPLDLSALVLTADQVLGFPTDAPVYNDQGNSVTNQYDEALHRFGVELVRATSDGEVTFQASVNTPGRVVALAEAGATLYSLAPSHLDADHITALLHRLRVARGKATIERSLDVGVGFRDAFASGQSIHFLLGPESFCYGASSERESTFFSVDLEAWERGASLTLPWDGWTFNRSGRADGASSVLLNGGPAGYRGRAEIDVSDAEPEVAQYFTVTP